MLLSLRFYFASRNISLPEMNWRMCLDYIPDSAIQIIILYFWTPKVKVRNVFKISDSPNSTIKVWLSQAVEGHSSLYHLELFMSQLKIEKWISSDMSPDLKLGVLKPKILIWLDFYFVFTSWFFRNYGNNFYVSIRLIVHTLMQWYYKLH